VPLLAGAIRRASRTALAMEARGLARHGRPTVLDAPRWHGRDTLAVLAGVPLPLLVLMVPWMV
jgi:energy-coupling factor transport system permease protein